MDVSQDSRSTVYCAGDLVTQQTKQKISPCPFFGHYLPDFPWFTKKFSVHNGASIQILPTMLSLDVCPHSQLLQLFLFQHLQFCEETSTHVNGKVFPKVIPNSPASDPLGPSAASAGCFPVKVQPQQVQNSEEPEVAQDQDDKQSTANLRYKGQKERFTASINHICLLLRL